MPFSSTRNALNWSNNSIGLRINTKRLILFNIRKVLEFKTENTMLRYNSRQLLIALYIVTAANIKVGY